MIRERKPDKWKAQSMLQAVQKEIMFIKTIALTEESAATIVRSIYECFRMLGDALLAIRGKEATGQDHHNQMINELFTLKVQTKRPIQIISNLKNIRHKINYQGYVPTRAEAQEAVDITNDCFLALYEKIKEEIDQK